MPDSPAKEWRADLAYKYGEAVIVDIEQDAAARVPCRAGYRMACPPASRGPYRSAVSVPVANTLPPIPAQAHARLNGRELDYLARLALNGTRKRIAADEGISYQRVTQVVDAALDKLNADSLIDAFRALGWLKPGGTWS